MKLNKKNVKEMSAQELQAISGGFKSEGDTATATATSSARSSAEAEAEAEASSSYK
jgi:bacteriocin-like protein